MALPTMVNRSRALPAVPGDQPAAEQKGYKWTSKGDRPNDLGGLSKEEGVPRWQLLVGEGTRSRGKPWDRAICFQTEGGQAIKDSGGQRRAEARA